MSKPLRRAVLAVCAVYVVALLVAHAHAGIIVYGPPWNPPVPDPPYAGLVGLLLVVAMMFL